MATQKATRPRSAKAASEAAAEKPIALTLKIDGKTYVRLSTLRAKQRATAQDILAAALKMYLDEVGA
jgi:hypothetical protein